VLALLLVAISAIAIALVAWAAIDKSGNAEADKVFTAVLGIIGTWVGTILAFYFSKENFQAAQNAMVTAVATASKPNVAAAVAVRAVMINRNSIKDVKIGDGADERSVLIKTLIEKFKAESITRIPVFRNDVVLYSIYDASIFRFLSERQIAGQPIDMAAATLADFLAHPLGDGTTFKSVVTVMAFTAVTGTLEDAKAALASGSGARDVFVTKSGLSTEPVLGWLTDIDIAKISGS
jgi:hypothetical protein